MRNYGKSADFAEHFLNTDDFVPTTNEPLVRIRGKRNTATNNANYSCGMLMVVLIVGRIIGFTP